MGTADSVRAIVKCRRHVNTDPAWHGMAWQGRGSESRFPLTLAIDEGGAVANKGGRCGALTPRQRVWADSMSLKCHGPARYPGRLVILVRCRTWRRSTRVGRTQVDPVLDGVVIEREQLVQVAGGLRGGPRELGAIAASKALTAARAWSLSSAPQISARAFFAPGCADFRQRSGTFAILWNLQRDSLESPVQMSSSYAFTMNRIVGTTRLRHSLSRSNRRCAVTRHDEDYGRVR
jgi:hypothetical protein